MKYKVIVVYQRQEKHKVHWDDNRVVKIEARTGT